MEQVINNAETLDPDNADALKDLCYATLNYGAAAQKQFEHFGTTGYGGTEIPIANTKVTQDGYQPVTIPDDLAGDDSSTLNLSNIDLKYYASSLGLFADTNYAICFEFSGDYDIDTRLTVTMADSGEELYSYKTGDAYYDVTDAEGNSSSYQHDMIAFTIRDIAAKDLLNDFKVNFNYHRYSYWDYNDEGDYVQFPEQNYSASYTFSPRNYLAKVIKETGVDPDYTTGYVDNHAESTLYNTKEHQTLANLRNTVQAIYDYSVKAKAYFS